MLNTKCFYIIVGMFIVIWFKLHLLDQAFHALVIQSIYVWYASIVSITSVNIPNINQTNYKLHDWLTWICNLSCCSQNNIVMFSKKVVKASWEIGSHSASHSCCSYVCIHSAQSYCIFYLGNLHLYNICISFHNNIQIGICLHRILFMIKQAIFKLV